MEMNVNDTGQMNFNLPHDVVPLPSGGIFYPSKKKSVKVGYLTAVDENILVSIDSRKTVKESIILPLLRNKLYEPDLRPEELLDGDIEAILLFLRNTSFGPEYNINAIDPGTGKEFTANLLLDELNIKRPKVSPDPDGTFTTQLPKSNLTVKLKPLTMRDTIEIENILDKYPQGRVSPVVTLRLNRMIVELNGNSNKEEISKFIETMPILDSKHVRSFLVENEPRLDLTREVIAPSGEKVSLSIAFGVEFFRPFFAV
jgi:hypothetical protein